MSEGAGEEVEVLKRNYFPPSWGGGGGGGGGIILHHLEGDC